MRLMLLLLVLLLVLQPQKPIIFLKPPKSLEQTSNQFQAVSHRIRKLGAARKLCQLLFLKVPTMHLSVSVGCSSHLCVMPGARYTNCLTQRQPGNGEEKETTEVKFKSAAHFPCAGSGVLSYPAGM